VLDTAGPVAATGAGVARGVPAAQHLRPADDHREPRHRIEQLADPGTLGLWAEDGGVATAVVEIHGIPTAVFATDARVQGGALGAEGADMIVALYRVAMARALPVIGIWQSGGARLREGVGSLDGMGRIFSAMTAMSGRQLQVSVVTGPAAGGAAYGPALTDLVVLTPEARVFVTGPDIVREVTGEDVDAATLGGPDAHMEHSGLGHVAADSFEDALARTRRIVALVGRTRVPFAPRQRVGPSLRALVPVNPRIAYDVRPVLAALLDDAPEELQREYAGSIVTALGRLAGRTVGVVANNPAWLAGCLDAPASDKAARFVRFCDSQGIPLVVLVDVPGYLPGVRQEHEGVVRRGAKLLHAFARAGVPRVTVVLRKAYGGAYIAMNSRSLGATAVFAWPDAEIDVMSAVAAVRVTGRRALAAARPEERDALHARLAVEHAELTGGARRARELGYVDEVIDPDDTRGAVAAALTAAPATRGRLTNIPL
jgi:acetyl-CoA/propionyl-CoA carboxylase carboxyl transferase subunit